MNKTLIFDFFDLLPCLPTYRINSRYLDALKEIPSKTGKSLCTKQCPQGPV